MRLPKSAKRLKLATAVAAALIPGALAAERVEVDCGVLEGTTDKASGVTSFKGIPYAAPPVGPLRWRPPAPPKKWTRVRKADKFGPRAMQLPIFDDMVFRSDGMSEDCLYLNIWVPADRGGKKLPVLVYFYGGGFVAGDGSEPRYDGASMASLGIVAVTVNYRLGVFGFLAHPALTKESPHRASGNYGLLDQSAALTWVRANIAAFGGDPARITIAGESAGSSSVSAQMASPLSRDLIAGAIGESGSILGKRDSLAEAEKKGVKFTARLGLGKNPSPAKLRKMPAKKLLEATGKEGTPWFSPVVDGWFLPEAPDRIFASGKQARVPLLAGSNSAEGSWNWLMGDREPTVENYEAVLKKEYADAADDVFAAYPATTEAEVMAAARDLASDRFISHETWLWLDLATRTSDKPTWYYLYAQPRPRMAEAKADRSPPTAGAAHSAEIEYALGNLDLNPVYAWTPADREVSRVMREYFANFIKTGDPNGPGLPKWPDYGSDKRMIIDTAPHAEPVKVRARYELLSRLKGK